MRVVCVGGAGMMGRRGAETVADYPEITEIVIADRDVATAEAVASKIGEKACPVSFDAHRDDPRDLLRGAWGVLNTLGPFTTFGLRVLEAAIEVGCQYVDINDDWEPTLEALALTDRARQAGVAAILGMGASPGITNLLALSAARELDTVEELVTGWVLASMTTDAPEGTPTAATRHFVHQCTGSIRAIEDARWQDVAPFRELVVDYPGVGDLRTRTIGHPEAVTLPRMWPSLRRCSNVMVGPSWYFDLAGDLFRRVDAGEITPDEAAQTISERHERPAEALRGPRTPLLWGWASGSRAGESTVVAAGLNRRPPGKMDGLTAVPAAVTLGMLARGQVVASGVLAPEEAVPVDAFFAALAPFCDPADSDQPVMSVSNAHGGPSVIASREARRAR